METNKSKIGDLYRDAFKEFSAEPSPKVWENISKHPGLNPAPKQGMLSTGKILLFTAALIIGVSVFIFTKSEKSAPVKQSQPQNTTATTEVSDGVQPLNKIADEKADKKQTPGNITGGNGQSSAKSNENFSGEKKPTVISPVQKPKLNNLVSEPEQKNQKTATNSPIYPKQEVTSVAVTGSKVKKSDNSSTSPQPSYAENQVKSTIDFSDDQMICKGDSVKLTASGGESYSWSNGSNTENITVSPTSTTTYSITVTDFDGALIIHEIIVKVGDCGTISIPNAFTPNADGTNDVFKASGNDITNFSMLIFSRTSQIVFESHEIGKGWDGIFKGKMAEPGVFVYQVKYTDSLGKSHTVNGHLTLLR
jgi:gliding motility-associated-like protein